MRQSKGLLAHAASMAHPGTLKQPDLFKIDWEAWGELKSGSYEIVLTAQIRASFWDVSWCEMVASQCRIALERLCSEAADENDETCLNIGWDVKIIRCKVAHYRILHIFSSPFSPCTLLWQPAVASLLAHSGFFLPSFFNPYCICWFIMLLNGTIT